MANPFDIANFNLMNWAESQDDLWDSTPKDVVIAQKDANGIIHEKTVANRGKFQKQVWDDVGGALGQFSKTFYVDSVNGDDNNDGNQSNPFKTIQKAFNSIPIGGAGRIYIVGICDIGTELIFTGDNKIINIIIGNNAQLKTTPNDNGDHVVFGTIVIGSNTAVRIYISTTDGADNQLVKIYQPTINSNNPLRPTAQGMFGFNSASTGNSYLGISTRVRDTNNEIIRVEKGNFFYRYNWSADRVGTAGFSISGHYTGKIVIDPDNARLANFDGTASTFNYSTSGYGIEDLNGNTVNVQDVIAGIVKDTNGVPRNLQSNLVF